MVDFKKLRANQAQSKIHDPVEIFRRLPKPEEIVDLYTSQSEVLGQWYEYRDKPDTVLKLHTGGGKTLVGLLIAQSTLVELSLPVLYLVPTTQLVTQTLSKAKAYGVNAVAYEKGTDLNSSFINGDSVMVATYSALFNGKSKFEKAIGENPLELGALILDDAHAAFSVIREAFTMDIDAKAHASVYQSLTSEFRLSFQEMDRVGTFDDIISQNEYGTLEIPYWAWKEKLGAVVEHLRTISSLYPFQWPLLRDNLKYCHAIVDRDRISITPILPMVKLFRSYSGAKRKIFMSATISDDSDVVRTFDASEECIKNPIKSRSLAGISERMILVPELIALKNDARERIKKMLLAIASKNIGAVILTPSKEAADEWADIATVCKTPAEVDNAVTALQNGNRSHVVAFANRYDGVDLPGNACRVLVMSGLPKGTTTYDLYRAEVLHGGESIIRVIAQRVEQGIGRGARGGGDYCVVILLGSDINGWIARSKNFKMLTVATQAQLDMGLEISKSISDEGELIDTIKQCLTREEAWIKFHAESLADATANHVEKEIDFSAVVAERNAFNLWSDGHHQKALAKLSVVQNACLCKETAGWLMQLSARIANDWGDRELANLQQKSAYANNRRLLRLTSNPPYAAMTVPIDQAIAIANNVAEYHMPRGLLKAFDDAASYLHSGATAKQFEKAIMDIGNIIGFKCDRFDNHGVGPDVLWLLPNSTGWVIEAKSRKHAGNPLSKADHGQLLVAAEWFVEQYPGVSPVRVSILDSNQAIPSAQATESFALTLRQLSSLVAECRAVLAEICDSQLTGESLVQFCANTLMKSRINADQITGFLNKFEIARK